MNAVRRSHVVAVMVILACLAGCGRRPPRPDVQAEIVRLRSESEDERYVALSHLQTLGPDGREAVDELRTMLQTTKDATLAGEVAKTLGTMGPAAAAAVPELTTLLGSRAMWPRYAAVEALGRVGPAAAPALPTIVALTKDPDREVADAAHESVRRLRRAAQTKKK